MDKSRLLMIIASIFFFLAALFSYMARNINNTIMFALLGVTFLIISFLKIKNG